MVKSSVSRTDGSEEKVYRWVTVAHIAFYQNIENQIWHLGGAFELHLARGGREGGGDLNELIFKSSNARGGCPEGEC